MPAPLFASRMAASIVLARQLLLSACWLLACATGSWAQEWPNAPIKLIIPFAPGGGNDGAGRVLAKAMEDRLKVPVVVENKPGGNTIVAAEHVAKSPADGYNL